jgi:lipid-A-disaccharide synthase
MPELVQRQATPEGLAAALSPLLGDTPERRRQLDAFARLDDVMQIATARPSAKGAEIVLRLAREGRPAAPQASPETTLYQSPQRGIK